jgi:hypothetical protein
MLQAITSVCNRPRPVGADLRDYGYVHLHLHVRGLGSALPPTRLTKLTPY